MVRDVTKGAVVAGVSVLFLILLVGLAGAFENENATVVLDLDPADGNQGMTTLAAAVGEEVVVEVYGTVVDIKGFTIQIGFDAEKLSFVKESSTVESGFQVLPPDLIDGDAGAVGLLLAGTKSGDPLLLAKMVFKPLEDFRSATLTVTKAEFTSPSGTDRPTVDATAKITEEGIAVETESWGKVKARFVQ